MQSTTHDSTACKTNRLASQFSNPHGWLGHVVGLAMAVKNQRRVEWSVDQCPVQAGQTVLEVGHGPGLALVRLLERVGPTGHVHGIDRSPLMIQQARRRNRLSFTRKTLTLQQAALPDLPLPDASVDGILLINTLKHAGPVHESLPELCRVLRTKGWLVIAEQPIGGPASTAPPSILNTARATLHELRPHCDSELVSTTEAPGQPVFLLRNQCR